MKQIAKFRRILEAAENGRRAWPWVYKLECGHYFYGCKTEWVRGGHIHQKTMRCGLCSTGYDTEYFVKSEDYDHAWAHKWAPIADYLPGGERK